MASFKFFTGVISSQTLGGNETGYVGRDAVIDGNIYGSGNNNDLRVYGTVVSSVAITMSGYNNSIFIGSTGIVDGLASSSTGTAAIELLVDDAAVAALGRLFNAGQVSGNGMALFARLLDSGDRAVISNTGSFLGEEAGIFTTGSGTIQIDNSGLISGVRFGVTNTMTAFNSSATQVSIVNSGTISGDEGSVFTGAAVDNLTNSGLLQGNVSLGDGDDILTNRGTINGMVNMGPGNDHVDARTGAINGEISLEGGKDTFIGNALVAENVKGGGGVDLLDFRMGPAVILALDGKFGADGAALGDSYSGFENVYGSNSKADMIRGTGAKNLLVGNGGNDKLDGAEGKDMLLGGSGVDVLTGGRGNDVFRFNARNECGDKITDFHNVSGDNDKFVFDSAGFGGGLTAGTLAANQFQTRADKLAQDANDRFIFNTTNQTLWFDADGNGAGAAIMVADMQAGATMSVSDILIL